MRWWRLASSGTTPPQRWWMSIWVETTSERTRRPSSTSAAAVSSQEVSMPRTITKQSGDELFEHRPHLVGRRTLRLEQEKLLICPDRVRVATGELISHSKREPRLRVVAPGGQRFLKKSQCFRIPGSSRI